VIPVAAVSRVRLKAAATAADNLREKTATALGAGVLPRVGFPAALIERLRWLSALIGTVGAVGAVGGVLSADGPAVWRALGVFAVVVLVASWWTSCRRGEPRRFADAVGAVAMLVVVSTRAAPQQAQALLYPSVWSSHSTARTEPPRGSSLCWSRPSSVGWCSQLRPTARGFRAPPVGHRRSRSAMRSGAVVARLGGDKFALLLPDVAAPGAAELGGRLLSVLGALVQVRDACACHHRRSSRM
jgi:hypothetical protein